MMPVPAAWKSGPIRPNQKEITHAPQEDGDDDEPELDDSRKEL